MKKRYIFAIVLYNKLLNESSTYNSLKSQVNEEDIIVVFDNSTEILYQELPDDIIYMTKNENCGLSKAYNYIFEEIIDFNYEYLVLFDDDSKPEDKYIEILSKSNLSDINLTNIFDEKGNKTSPEFHSENICYEEIIKRLGFLKKTNYYNSNLVGINSGLILKKKIVDSYRYSNDLFLDCVDLKFFTDQRKLGNEINHTNLVLVQKFHVLEKGSVNIDSLIKRCEIRLLDSKNYAPKHYIMNKLCIILVYTKNTKSLKFFKFLFK